MLGRGTSSDLEPGLCALLEATLDRRCNIQIMARAKTIGRTQCRGNILITDNCSLLPASCSGAPCSLSVV
jgi:hypothetical protein